MSVEADESPRAPAGAALNRLKPNATPAGGFTDWRLLLERPGSFTGEAKVDLGRLRLHAAGRIIAA